MRVRFRDKTMALVLGAWLVTALVGVGATEHYRSRLVATEAQVQQLERDLAESQVQCLDVLQGAIDQKRAALLGAVKIVALKRRLGILGESEPAWLVREVEDAIRQEPLLAPRPGEDVL